MRITLGTKIRYILTPSGEKKVLEFGGLASRIPFLTGEGFVAPLWELMQRFGPAVKKTSDFFKVMEVIPDLEQVEARVFYSKMSAARFRFRRALERFSIVGDDVISRRHGRIEGEISVMRQRKQVFTIQCKMRRDGHDERIYFEGNELVGDTTELTPTHFQDGDILSFLLEGGVNTLLERYRKD